MAELKNEFSWSKSRAEVFNVCQRQYYFQYYGSWGGWEFNAPSRTRQIYVLKNLTSRQAWAGQVVHDTIKTLLHTQKNFLEIPGIEEITNKALARMRHDFKNSKEKFYIKKPKTCGLFEHEYEIDVPDSVWKENAAHVAHCIKTFLDSETFSFITSTSPDTWLEFENLSFFMLDDIKVWVVLDFALKEKNDIIIYDWKTGKAEDEHILQLACYTHYAKEKWNTPLEKIATIEFNLAHNKLNKRKLDASTLNNALDEIKTSSQKMQELLSDSKENKASEERFAFTKNEKICSYCNFKKVCPRWEN